VEELEWLPGVPQAMATLSTHFSRIVVITNQMGIAKGLMSSTDVEAIHRHMGGVIAQVGGIVDAFLYCGKHKLDPSNRRKPRPDLGVEAKTLFPEIDFSRSIMVGDSPSDMAFAHALGMKAVRLCTRFDLSDEEWAAVRPYVSFDSLEGVADFCDRHGVPALLAASQV
jgi:histidinol-phosphate phosphatase family protein